MLEANTSTAVRKLVEDFVGRINGGCREPLFTPEVPPWLRVGQASEGITDWRIVAAEAKAWLPAFEARLPAPLDPSFRELLAHYAYPEFEFAEVWMYPNTGGLDRDFEKAALADDHLVRPLLTAGFIPFARPAGGSYDPLCFDTINQIGKDDWRIVRADHEEALRNGRVVVKPYAESFAKLLQQS
jgi:hypothetical protein